MLEEILKQLEESHKIYVLREILFWNYSSHFNDWINQPEQADIKPMVDRQRALIRSATPEIQEYLNIFTKALQLHFIDISELRSELAKTELNRSPSSESATNFFKLLEGMMKEISSSSIVSSWIKIQADASKLIWGLRDELTKNPLMMELVVNLMKYNSNKDIHFERWLNTPGNEVHRTQAVEFRTAIQTLQEDPFLTDGYNLFTLNWKSYADSELFYKNFLRGLRFSPISGYHTIISKFMALIKSLNDNSPSIYVAYREEQDRLQTIGIADKQKIAELEEEHPEDWDRRLCLLRPFPDEKKEDKTEAKSSKTSTPPLTISLRSAAPSVIACNEDVQNIASLFMRLEGVDEKIGYEAIINVDGVGAKQVTLFDTDTNINYSIYHPDDTHLSSHMARLTKNNSENAKIIDEMVAHYLTSAAEYKTKLASSEVVIQQTVGGKTYQTILEPNDFIAVIELLSKRGVSNLTIADILLHICDRYPEITIFENLEKICIPSGELKSLVRRQSEGTSSSTTPLDRHGQTEFSLARLVADHRTPQASILASASSPLSLLLTGPISASPSRTKSTILRLHKTPERSPKSLTDLLNTPGKVVCSTPPRNVKKRNLEPSPDPRALSRSKKNLDPNVGSSATYKLRLA